MNNIHIAKAKQKEVPRIHPCEARHSSGRQDKMFSNSEFQTEDVSFSGGRNRYYTLSGGWHFEELGTG